MTFEPWTWPLWWRRIFLLTLPVSVPLWVCAVLITVAAIMVFVMVVGIPCAIYETMWKDEGR